MVPRIIAILVIVAALMAVLVYSQQRRVPERVSGFIEAYQIRVGSHVGGRIAEVPAREGQAVKAGDLLVRLEPYDLADRLRAAEAVLAQKRAEYERLVKGYRPEEIAQAQARQEQLQAQLDKLVAGPRKQDIAAAQARLDQAVALRDLAESNYKRVSGLFKTNNASPDELDRATNDLQVQRTTLRVRQEELAQLKEGSRPEDIDAAKAQVAEAKAALLLMRNGSRAEDIAAAKAAMEAQQATLASLQTQMAELKIVAPVAGVVEAVDLRPGDLLAPNAPGLSILDPSELWVRAYVPENRLNLAVGQKVRVTVDSFPGRNFTGEVTFLARQAEFTPNNVQTIEERSKQVFRIKVTMKDGLDVLHPGMSADVWLTNK